MGKHTCKDCTERKVGCHSTCAKYVVKRVIQTYKNQKKCNEYQYSFDPNGYERNSRKLRKQLSGHY